MIHNTLQHRYKVLMLFCNQYKWFTKGIIKESIGVSKVINGSLHLVVTGVHVQLQLGMALDFWNVHTAGDPVTGGGNVTAHAVRISDVGHCVIGETRTL